MVVGPGQMMNQLLAAQLEVWTGEQWGMAARLHSLPPVLESSTDEACRRLVLWNGQGKTGQQLTSPSWAPVISDDGMRVAFVSAGDAILGKPASGVAQVYVRDLSTSAVLPVSVATAGQWGDGDSGEPTISGDGVKVAFSSLATNLQAGDQGIILDVFLHDLSSNVTRRMSSSASDGNSADAFSICPALSRGGDYLLYTSRATDLISGDSNSKRDIFIADTP